MHRDLPAELDQRNRYAKRSIGEDMTEAWILAQPVQTCQYRLLARRVCFLDKNTSVIASLAKTRAHLSSASRGEKAAQALARSQEIY